MSSRKIIPAAEGWAVLLAVSGEKAVDRFIHEPIIAWLIETSDDHPQKFEGAPIVFTYPVTVSGFVTRNDGRSDPILRPDGTVTIVEDSDYDSIVDCMNDLNTR